MANTTNNGLFATRHTDPDAYRPIGWALQDKAPSAQNLRTRGEFARKAIAARRMGMIVVDECPFCHCKHRFRHANFDDLVPAHCCQGTIRLVEKAK